MASYQTVLVGTDGSATSFAAVDRAAGVAESNRAKLVIVCAYEPATRQEVAHAQEALREEAWQVVGSAPAEDTLQTARDRAVKAGARDVDTFAVQGEPVGSLLRAAKQRAADLIVVGNRGLSSLAGRILGSVPSEVARKSDVDVLIVHTT